MPTSRSTTTTTRISARTVESCQAYRSIFEEGLDGEVKGVLSVILFVVIGDTLVLVRFF
jgi:hypothetical protein